GFIQPEYPLVILRCRVSHLLHHLLHARDRLAADRAARGPHDCRSALIRLWRAPAHSTGCPSALRQRWSAGPFTSYGMSQYSGWGWLSSPPTALSHAEGPCEGAAGGGQTMCSARGHRFREASEELRTNVQEWQDRLTL